MADMENGEQEEPFQEESVEFDGGSHGHHSGGDGEQISVGNESGVEDPELEAIKARVREMEEEAEKLKELQNEVEKQMNMTSPTSATFPTMEEKIEADSRSIYVGNVDYGATAEELEQHFHGCGSINRVTILCDKYTGHPKGFAYVEFADKDSVGTAMALDDSLFRGRQIKVMSKRTNRPGISTTNRPPKGRFRRASYQRNNPYYPYTPRPRPRYSRFRRSIWYSPY